MSDMMAQKPPMPGGMGGGGMGSPGGLPRSTFNPMDMAAKAKTGQMSPNMTVAQFLQQNYGVSPNDPLSKFVQAVQGQMKTKDMPGKLAAMGGQVPGMGGPSQAPRMPQKPMGAPGGAPGISGLMSGLKG